MPVAGVDHGFEEMDHVAEDAAGPAFPGGFPSDFAVEFLFDVALEADFVFGALVWHGVSHDMGGRANVNIRLGRARAWQKEGVKREGAKSRSGFLPCFHPLVAKNFSPTDAHGRTQCSELAKFR